MPDAFGAQWEHLFGWLPVGLAGGIGLYFALPGEPAVWALVVCAGGALSGTAILLFLPRQAAPWVWLPVLLLGGFALAGGRAHWLAAPVLEYRLHGPVEGRIVALDRSGAGAPRVTLDRVWLRGVAPEETPVRVRLSLHGGHPEFELHPGQTVMATAFLAPLPAPAEPGGFDFRRHAWFQELGAVGYSRGPLMLLEHPRPGAGLWVARLRSDLSTALQERLPGVQGAFAAAILTGERSAIPEAILQDLRDSNLAHLLAISGLHMGLLTGVVFTMLRYGLALIPPLALRVPGKKLAAVGAFLAGAGYLALSGGNVATERAFIMVSVVLVAVLADRRALTLRAVALAALIVLVLSPESLTQAGFQMSFAATTALVAVFSALRNRPGRYPRWVRPVWALLVSSAVAGAATAPFGAGHFNQVAHYGLLANLLSVPLMGGLIIPAAVLATCLAPLGLEALGLVPMGWGIAWILMVSEWVSGLKGAVWTVPSPGPWVLPLISLGGIFCMLWQGWGRVAGIVPMLLGLWLWGQVERPALLVSQSGGLAGVLGPEGRALSKPRGDGFSARVWLENDGDPVPQRAAAARPGWQEQGGVAFTRLGKTTIAHLTGRGWQDRLVAACALGLVITNQEIPTPPSGCRVIDRHGLARSGALAFYLREGDLLRREAKTARRLWSGQ
nr:ComEC/Rec2 family competence protein [Rhodovulum imhoffii]